MTTALIAARRARHPPMQRDEENRLKRGNAYDNHEQARNSERSTDGAESLVQQATGKTGAGRIRNPDLREQRQQQTDREPFGHSYQPHKNKHRRKLPAQISDDIDQKLKIKLHRLWEPVISNARSKLSPRHEAPRFAEESARRRFLPSGIKLRLSGPVRGIDR